MTVLRRNLEVPPGSLPDFIASELSRGLRGFLSGLDRRAFRYFGRPFLLLRQGWRVLPPPDKGTRLYSYGDVPRLGQVLMVDRGSGVATLYCFTRHPVHRVRMRLLDHEVEANGLVGEGDGVDPRVARLLRLSEVA
ncbi:MAG: hypothetical protein AB1758_30010 [Candidatus Eremiobacterota bacterium]